jgi:two-component system, LuxR family, sensor kinase FixL
MGLSLVRGLVEAMGGRVWYEPGPNGGASFRFMLPPPRVHP